MNDFSTRTQGIDIVSTWTPLAIGGRTTLSGVFNYTDTDVTDFSTEHFDADRVTSLTLGLPRTRWNIGVNQTEDHWTLMARLHYYGAYWDREDARSELGNAMSYLYPLYSGKPLVDLEVGFPLNDVTLSVGAQNIFNTYPDENPGAVAGVGNRYGQFGPVRLSTAATTTCASTTGGASACSWQEVRNVLPHLPQASAVLASVILAAILLGAERCKRAGRPQRHGHGHDRPGSAGAQ